MVGSIEGDAATHGLRRVRSIEIASSCGLALLGMVSDTGMFLSRSKSSACDVFKYSVLF